MGTGSFSGVKSGRGVTLTPHPLLVPWSWKGRAIPLLPLWAVRPIQSLSACTRVHFTLPFNDGYSNCWRVRHYIPVIRAAWKLSKNIFLLVLQALVRNRETDWCCIEVCTGAIWKGSYAFTPDFISRTNWIACEVTFE